MRRSTLIRMVGAVVISASIAGCASRAAVVSAGPSSAARPAAAAAEAGRSTAATEKLNALRNTSFDFNTISARAKADLAIGSSSNDVNMILRVRNKEAIWVSVTALAGLEVARALITPDSVKILNRLENQYMVKPFSYLQQFTNNQITFEMLQAVLLGQPVAGLLAEDAAVNLNGDAFQILSTNKGLKYALSGEGAQQITSAQLSDEASGRSLQVKYDGFADVAGRLFPHQVIVESAAGPKNIRLNLQFSRIDRDVPVDMPFRVPDRFVLKN